MKSDGEEDEEVKYLSTSDIKESVKGKKAEDIND